MSNEIAPWDETWQILLPADAGKDTRHRLSKFAGWLVDTERGWAMPDLREYRDHLLYEELLSPESVAVHLSSVRSRYRELLLDRQLFFSMVPPQENFAEHKALVDELVTRIENAINPRSAPVRTRKRQDRPDSDHLRLTIDQARELLHAPDTSKLVGMRDRAVIAMLLCTGLREAELCALEVHDLSQQLDGQLAVHVRFGKGRKERLVPYGDLRWALRMAKAWLGDAQIGSGPAFRGLRKGDRVRTTALNERTIQKILARYPLRIDGRLAVVKPHDCRRTYARWLYTAGMDINAIRQNMGHDSVQMTFRYIGNPDTVERLPPALFGEGL